MTRIVGILNLTPDSFSRDGTLLLEQALKRIDAMIADGASMIDIGAESTRPGAIALSPTEEWRRLEPVAQALGSRKAKVDFSIDTRHAEVAQKAIAAGFAWINDVSGGADPAMFALVHAAGCKYVPMHSLGIPADPSRTLAKHDDPTQEVCEWGKQMLGRMESSGIERSKIILDPGIGFGKSAEQSFALLKNIDQLQSLGVPVLVGHSRKSFLSLFTDKPSGERDPETLAVSCFLAARGVDYLRVHDVKSHAAMLRMGAAL